MNLFPFRNCGMKLPASVHLAGDGPSGELYKLRDVWSFVMELHPKKEYGRVPSTLSHAAPKKFPMFAVCALSHAWEFITRRAA